MPWPVFVFCPAPFKQNWFCIKLLLLCSSQGNLQNVQSYMSRKTNCPSLPNSPEMCLSTMLMDLIINIIYNSDVIKVRIKITLISLWNGTLERSSGLNKIRIYNRNVIFMAALQRKMSVSLDKPRSREHTSEDGQWTRHLYPAD